jgi:DNA-binding CsgD family transcriptional regulator
MVRAATSRVSVLVCLHDILEKGDSAEKQFGPIRDFPIWCNEKNFLIGIGRPVSHYYPVLAICKNEPQVSTEVRSILKFALTYVHQALTEHIYSKPIWPEGLAQATLKLLSIGYFVVSRGGEIEIDGREISQQECSFLTVAHNRLSTPDTKDRAALAEAIRLAAGEEKTSSILSISSGEDQLKMVLVAPFEQGVGGQALILFEADGTDHGVLREHFFRAHAITRSESLVAHEVLNGRSPAEASASTGLSLETVRSYLKQVFYKTGTHRQSELISLYYSWTLPVGKQIASAEIRRRS